MNLRTAGRRLRALLGPRAVILLYHRVAEETSDPYGLCTRPDRFEQHLQVIRRIARPLPLAELARLLRDNQVPADAVCVTFDDGYQDNLHTAAPLLQRYEVPATCFVTTGRMGRDREFWWDELESIFLGGGALPPRLELELAAGPIVFDLGDSAGANGADGATSRWTFQDAVAPGARHEALRTLHGRLQPLTEDARNEVLDRLHGWAGSTPRLRASHRALNPDEVAALERDAPIDVGAHTVSHPLLPAQPAAVQQMEIASSRRALEEWLNHPVTRFAYPYGAWSDASLAALHEGGFDCACAGIWGGVRLDSAPYLLPRVEPADRDGTAFEAFLRRYLRR